jgi:hypothetical protein
LGRGVPKGGTRPVPDLGRGVPKGGTRPVPDLGRGVPKRGHKEQPTRKNNIRKTQQEQQQQGAKRVVGKRDAVAVVEMLRSIGLGEGPALTRARNGEVSEDVARAWVDWVDHAPQSFRDPVAYVARRLGEDPSALPPAESRGRGRSSRIIDTLRELQAAGLIER